MKFFLALQQRRLMNAPNEGTPSATTPATTTTPTPPQGTEPAPAEGSLLGDGATPPAPAGNEGGGSQAAPEGSAPLTLESVKLPEGFEDVVLETVGEGADAKQVTALSKALDIMNDAAMSPADRLQKLVDLQQSVVSLTANAAAEAWTGMQTQWRQEVQALPEIGGAKLPETLATIKKGLDQSGADKAFYDAMTLTGAGNNPAVVKVLYALTKNLSEGKPVLGEPPKGKLPIEARLYPTMFAKE